MGLFSIIGKIAARGKIKKAQKFADKASALERQQAQMATGIQRREMVRQARISRGQAVAAAASESGGLQSSAPQGARSSLSSQFTSNLNYFDTQVGLGNEVQGYKAKAGKYARQADNLTSLGNLLDEINDFAAASMAPAKPGA